MKERFGLDKKTFTPVSSDVPDGLMDYDYSLCYLHPESYLHGANCPTKPWVVTFDARGSSGTYPPLAYDWIIAGDTQCSSVIAPRIEHTATLLPNGKVLIAGGRSANNVSLASAELYDFVTGTFNPTGSMAIGRKGHTATLLPNGKVLIAGGAEVGPTAEIFDPERGTFIATGSMISRRANHTATLLPNGKVLIAGGRRTQRLSSAELYFEDSFLPTGNMSTTREGHTATLLPNGKVLIAGGGAFGAGFAELYDPAGTFRPTTGSISHSFSFHTATLLGNGKVLIAGGSPASAPYSTTAELYDPDAATNAFSPTTGSMTGRVGHTATLLQNGKVLIAGGLSGSTTLATAELFDPDAPTNAFSPTTGSLSLERKYQTATLLPNGRVLIAGGISRSDYLTTAELYGPIGNTFAPPESASVTLGIPDSDPFLDSPIVSCAFAKQGTYPVTLRVKNALGNIGSMTRDVTVKDLLIVSIGDSVASGEGNPDRPRISAACFGESDCRSKLREHGATQWQIDRKVCAPNFCVVPAQWQDQRCHRSANAGPALAARSLEWIDPHASVTFLHLACSGADIVTEGGVLIGNWGIEPVDIDGNEIAPASGRVLTSTLTTVLTPRGQLVTIHSLPPQLGEVARLLCPKNFDSETEQCFDSSTGQRIPIRKIDILLVSVGANDINFGPAAKACAALPQCGRIADGTLVISVSGAGRDDVAQLTHDVAVVDDLLTQLPFKYQLLNTEIGRVLKDAVLPESVYVTEYPDPTHDENGNYCHMLRGTKDFAEDLEGWLKVNVGEILTVLDFDGIKPDESKWAFEKLLIALNQHVRDAARSFGWNYVGGMQSAFFFHGTCANEKSGVLDPGRWFNQLKDSKRAQGNLDGTLHPNLFGHTAYQTAIVDAITGKRAELAPVRARLEFVGLKNLVAHPTLGFRGLLVGSANQPPVANAGPDRIVRLESLVTLSGGGSSDPDAGPSSLSFSWAQTGGPAAVLTPANTATPTFTFTPPVEGSYMFSLVVNDGQANSTPDSVTIKAPVLGDIDLDGDVDNNDLKLLRAARNTRARGPNDLRDVDGDGKITDRDAKMLTQLCTRPRCATR